MFASASLFRGFVGLGLLVVLSGCGGGDTSVSVPADNRSLAPSPGASLSAAGLETQGAYLADLVRWLKVSSGWLFYPPLITEVGICPVPDQNSDDGGTISSSVFDAAGILLIAGQQVDIGGSAAWDIADCGGALYDADGVARFRIVDGEAQAGAAPAIHAALTVQGFGDAQAGLGSGPGELWWHGEDERLLRLYDLSWRLDGRAAAFDLDLRGQAGGLAVAGRIVIDGVAYGVRSTAVGLPDTVCEAAGDGCGEDLIALSDAAGNQVRLAFVGPRSYVLSYTAAGATTPVRVLDPQRWPDDVPDFGG